MSHLVLYEINMEQSLGELLEKFSVANYIREFLVDNGM